MRGRALGLLALGAALDGLGCDSKREVPAPSAAPVEAGLVSPAAEPVSLHWLEYTTTSTWALPQPFHWQMRISSGGAAELRDFQDGQPRLQRANLGEAQFRLLSEYLEDVHFEELGSHYDQSRLKVFDASENTISVSADWGDKSVSSYWLDAPPVLWALQQWLEHIQEHGNWKLAR